MRFTFAGIATAAMLALASPLAAADVRLIGSGASFPFPIYATWFKAFGKATPGVTVDYQAKGWGAGIQDLINHTVDFAASDAAMTDEQIAKVKDGVVLLPMTAGEIVLAYNLPGVTELKLPRDVYPEIFLGKINSWNDPRIAAANPGVTLPETKITVVRRSDSSGTTFVFTKHLSARQRGLQERPGLRHHRAVAGIGQHHRRAQERRRDRHDQADPGRHRLRRVRLRQAQQGADRDAQNKAGKYVPAGGEGGPVALASAKFPSETDLRAWVDRPAAGRGLPDRHLHLDAVLQGAGSGQGRDAAARWSSTASPTARRLRDSMGYIPLPAAVVEKVRAATAADHVTALRAPRPEGAGPAPFALAQAFALATGPRMAVNNPLADSRVAQSISQPPSAVDFAVDRTFTALDPGRRRRDHPDGGLYPLRDRRARRCRRSASTA